jgi:hypothetical protein
LAPELRPLELDFCAGVDVDMGVEVLEVVEVAPLDGLDGLDVLLVGAAEEEEEEDDDTETALPLCSVTVPSCVMKNPLPAAQQPWLPPTLSAHQLPSGQIVNGTSVPLSAN